MDCVRLETEAVSTWCGSGGFEPGDVPHLLQADVWCDPERSWTGHTGVGVAQSLYRMHIVLLVCGAQARGLLLMEQLCTCACLFEQSLIPDAADDDLQGQSI